MANQTPRPGEAGDARFDTPEKAYAEAERRIAAAQRSHATELAFQLRHLRDIPSAIVGLTALKTLSLTGTQVADLAPLAPLTALKTLWLAGTQVSDLAPLAGLKALETISLNRTQVADLTPLAGLKALLALSLNGTQVADLAPLAGLTALQALWLADTQVADLAPLAGLKALQTLWLAGTQVADLADLADRTALQALSLAGTQVADLAPLAGLAALQALSLNRTQVADLAPLAGLTALKTLWLTGSQVADLAPLAGLTALQALSLDRTQVADLAPLAGLLELSTAAQADKGNSLSLGLRYEHCPIARKAHFADLVRLEQPARTVETINYLRRLARPALPPFVPEGYQPPAGFTPPEPDAPLDEAQPGVAPPEAVIPGQGLATRYVAPADGPIDINRGAPLAPEERDRLAGLQAEMIEAAHELETVAKASNGYRSIVPSLQRYRTAIDRPVTDLRDGDLEILYARGIRIQDAYQDLQAEIDRSEAPPEDRRLRSPMQVLLSLHGPFLQTTKRGNELYEQTDRDRRTLADELALKERQRALNPALRAEATETTTETAFDEVEAQTEMMGAGRHPERASIAGRNANRNYWIAMAELARRFVRSRTVSPTATAKTLGKLAVGGIATTMAGKAAIGTKAGAAIIGGGTALLDGALGAGGALAQTAADFMVRHAHELRDLARAGGASFDWLITFVDWLTVSLKGRNPGGPETK